MQYDQYYLSYSGAALPLNLVSPLGAEDIENRNTYFGVNLDDHGRIELIHKRVYGDVELAHRYGYGDDNQLLWAEIFSVDEEGRRLSFDTAGRLVGDEEIPAP